MSRVDVPWISVQKEEPPKGRPILCLDNSGKVTVCTWNGHSFESDADFFWVTHWMTLPETPGGAEAASAHRLTSEERAVLASLGSAFNVFSRLGGHHPSDVEDFVRAIHEAQRIVACRPARRANPEVLR